MRGAIEYGQPLAGLSRVGSSRQKSDSEIRFRFGKRAKQSLGRLRGFRRAELFLSFAKPIFAAFCFVLLAFCYILLYEADFDAILVPFLLYEAYVAPFLPLILPYEADFDAILLLILLYEADFAPFLPLILPYETDFSTVFLAFSLCFAILCYMKPILMP